MQLFVFLNDDLLSNSRSCVMQEVPVKMIGSSLPAFQVHSEIDMENKSIFNVGHVNM